MRGAMEDGVRMKGLIEERMDCGLRSQPALTNRAGAGTLHRDKHYSRSDHRRRDLAAL